jgi:hypothetical protein
MIAYPKNILTKKQLIFWKQVKLQHADIFYFIFYELLILIFTCACDK